MLLHLVKIVNSAYHSHSKITIIFWNFSGCFTRTSAELGYLTSLNLEIFPGMYLEEWIYRDQYSSYFLSSNKNILEKSTITDVHTSMKEAKGQWYTDVDNKKRKM